MQQTGSVVVMIGILLGAGGKDDAVKRERDKLQGIWVFTELTDGGKKASDQERDSMRLEFKGDKLTITIKDAPKGEGPIVGTYTIDPQKSPATMDITLEANGKKFTVPAIYELKGDSLKLCHAVDEGGARPQAFESTPKNVLAILKRQKP